MRDANHSPADAPASQPAPAHPPISSAVDAVVAGAGTSARDRLRAAARDRGRRAIHRMCLARRAAKLEARDRNLPVVVAHREAQARLAFRQWCGAMGCAFALIGLAAACKEDR